MMFTITGPRSTSASGTNRFTSSSAPPATCSALLDLHSSVNRAHPTQTVIFNRLTDFRLRVHHKRPVARDWFVQGHSGDEQHFEPSLRVRRIFDSHFVAVLREKNHLPVPSALTLGSEESVSLHDVSEGVVSTRHLLGGRASGLDPVMQIVNWCARLNDGFLAHRFARNHTHHYQAVGRSRFRDLRVRDLLVARFNHLVALRQVHPKLESVHPPAVARELPGGHLRVDHTRSGSHPLHVTRP